MKDKIADMLIKSECYVNANKTRDNIIRAPNGDEIIAYLSCRLAISNVKVRDEIERQFAARIKDNFGDNITIVGMATAGITWAHGIAKELKLPMLYVWSSEKSYGLKGLIEGNINYAYKKAVIVDDVLYSGDTVKRGQKILVNNGIETVGIACIASLGKRVIREMLLNGINVIELTNYNAILEKALNQKILNKNEYIFMKKIYDKKWL